MRPSAIRIEAGLSVAYVARELGVAENTIKLFEADPERGVKTQWRRAAFSRYYRDLAESTERRRIIAKEVRRHASDRDVREPGSERRPRRARTSRALRSAIA